LRRGGIEYVEIRSLDLNVFDPVGINQNAMRFVESFLIYCLLMESPRLDDTAWDEAAANHGATAKRGRDPDLMLKRNGQPVSLKSWSREILDDVLLVAELIDAGSTGEEEYSLAVKAQAALVENADATPSARVLRELRERDCGFFDFALECARGHREYFLSLTPLAPERLKLFDDETRDSLKKQAEIEATDDISFEQYLQNYYASS
jgi:glutamate--cysteine ligase